MLLKLTIPQGKSLYQEAPFDVRRRLNETFKRFRVTTPSREVVGESLLRLERVCRKTKRYRHPSPVPKDRMSQTLFEMLKYYKSVK